ncbi:Lrp/AsnC family transcriptional regulator [Marinomonas mediterranea]|jgi:transcriptional regulator, AsnC family|uniref:Transcriptional regulator, AsnC family n=1 Tax=Marinomonas mediterranea (strain ATCC 700492 / JCM 21426 / NBRC 103028 / MMB-1) TaxID=717774 RepID=F2K2M9_MARM1|nr:Lrp/AsnC family transcriptional regulator [Marinomonas mediterranea]ADZ90074.1 transcriptional regulator, AsnC family [Marinomonas mediterranea MMB-1]WCN08138.1 winged helix-turn-helix transcriptional regulator [Marinomonas mediterranea]WCN12207.1 winged helix-turn-helix transcriptional regulator [Marinomonas mediterranea]WCN16279.1 winged helix-turn-helix transcriptional regulator [Marinomonas mediterranea MMB-1]
MSALELDCSDWRLLKALQGNARLSNVALSEIVDLSPSQCSRRLQRLEQNNIIEAYQTQLNSVELGYEVTAFVTVTLDKSTSDAIQLFQKNIKSLETVLECYSVTGDDDYWLKVIAKNLPELSDFLTENLGSMPGIKNVSSTIVLNKIKHTSDIPLPI